MYRSSNNDTNLQSFTVKGRAEMLDSEKYQGLVIYTDADFARDLNCRRSMSSNITEYNETAVA